MTEQEFSVYAYTSSFSYEIFICTAHNCERGMRYGADSSFMKNAMTMERGKTSARHLGSFQKQFEKVKNYISKALLKLSKRKPFSAEAAFFTALNDELAFATSTKTLIDIISRGQEKINELRED